MGNSFGTIYKLSSFGESHGPAVGGVIEGCPAGLEISVEKIQAELNRRRPGQNTLSTPRNEADSVEILSGLFEGKTTGMPIGFIVRNTDQNSSAYEHLKDTYRPSHADYTWQQKYGLRDYRGGGRSSAREHISRVVAGAVAQQFLALKDIKINAYTSQIGDIILPSSYKELNIETIDNPINCPDAAIATQMMELLKTVRAEGDSVGGCVSCAIRNMPVGLGEPVFDKLQARLAFAMMGINAAKGFEYGDGFTVAAMRGSEHNDTFTLKAGRIAPLTNHSGGIQGGVSNGKDIFFKVAFKPVPTIMRGQQTVTMQGEPLTLQAGGRHDVCVVHRAVPVVEAMTAMVLMDALLADKIGKI
ncbi:chorismate synthase [Bacteroidia bacterium]|nr:chorismate synthase [Bacteroidia bacterium]